MVLLVFNSLHLYHHNFLSSTSSKDSSTSLDGTASFDDCLFLDDDFLEDETDGTSKAVIWYEQYDTIWDEQKVSESVCYSLWRCSGCDDDMTGCWHEELCSIRSESECH